MIETVLFDFDGTISDSARGITKCVQYALSKFGIKVDDLSELVCFVGPPPPQMFKEKYGFSDEQALKGLEFGNCQQFYSCWQFISDGLEILRYHLFPCFFCCSRSCCCCRRWASSSRSCHLDFCTGLPSDAYTLARISSGWTNHFLITKVSPIVMRLDSR